MSLAQTKSAFNTIITLGGRALINRTPAWVDPACALIEHGDSGFDTFFGYYDVSPFDSNGCRLLAMRRPSDAGQRAAGTVLELGLFDRSAADSSFEPFATTTAWCWQQGCRLQWLRQDTREVLFNRTVADRHTSVVLEPGIRAPTAEYACALYAVNRAASYGVSLNFSRLQRLRPGYGYDDIPDTTLNETAPAKDGLWLVNLTSGASELILPLAQIAAFRPEGSMKGAHHYFNHVLWNPEGDRFFFLHLWCHPDGRRLARACIWDLRTFKYELLGPSGMVSHQCWMDDEHIVVFTGHPERGDCFQIYNVNGEYKGVIGAHKLTKDGHPSIREGDGRHMITDTYPDRLGEQALLLFPLGTGRLRRIARFYSPPQFRGQVRCDLHPRWDRSGSAVCVDSAHRGSRRLCVIEMPKNFLSKD